MPYFNPHNYSPPVITTPIKIMYMGTDIIYPGENNILQIMTMGSLIDYSFYPGLMTMGSSIPDNFASVQLSINSTQPSTSGGIFFSIGS